MTTDTKAIVDSDDIVAVVGELVLDDGVTLERQSGPQALAVARQIESALLPHLSSDQMRMSIWQGFQTNPTNTAPLLVTAVEMLLKADAALAQRLDTLLEQYKQAAHPATSTTINTGGGAYIGGTVTTSGGDFVGRDQTKIVGDGNVIGDHSSATVIKQTGLQAGEVTALFDRALALARQKPPELRDDLESAVETAKEEAEAGEDADKRLLSKMLDLLLDKGPDVLEIVVDAILSPGAAAGKGARLLARQAREALAKKRQSPS